MAGEKGRVRGCGVNKSRHGCLIRKTCGLIYDV